MIVGSLYQIAAKWRKNRNNVKTDKTLGEIPIGGGQKKYLFIRATCEQRKPGGGRDSVSQQYQSGITPVTSGLMVAEG